MFFCVALMENVYFCRKSGVENVYESQKSRYENVFLCISVR